MADVRLPPNGRIVQTLPASYNGFLYVLEGAVRVGAQLLLRGQVGWLDRPTGAGPTDLEMVAPDGPARVVLYAGEPQREPLVHYGPFVGGSQSDIHRLFHEYRSGRFEPLSHVAERQR